MNIQPAIQKGNSREVADIIDDWERQRKSGSLTLHFDHGELRKIEERRFIPIK